MFNRRMPLLMGSMAAMFATVLAAGSPPREDRGALGRASKRSGVPIMSRHTSLLYRNVSPAFRAAWSAMSDFPNGKSRQVLRAEHRRYCKAHHLNWRQHDWREVT